MRPILFSLFVVLLALAGCAQAQREADLRTRVSYSAKDQTLFYIFITNLPENCTHSYNETLCAPERAAMTEAVIDYKSIYMPETDQVTLLKVKDSYNRSKTENFSSKVVVYVGVPDPQNTTRLILSPRRLWKENSHVVGSFSAVVHLKAGAPTKIDWLEGCSECATAQCVDKTNCGLSEATCTNDSNACNVKVWVGWYGSDARNWPMTSMGSLPANLRVLSLGEVYKQAAGVEYANKNSVF